MSFLSWSTSSIYIYLTVNVVLISHRKWCERAYIYLHGSISSATRSYTPPSHLFHTPKDIRISEKLSFAYVLLCTIAQNFEEKENTKAKCKKICYKISFRVQFVETSNQKIIIFFIALGAQIIRSFRSIFRSFVRLTLLLIIFYS